uniref:Uncharacterized protein n=1 Tax=viral metagenome TaxID=1070528 RepID=A0A6M3XU70_9ZZZZ
MPYFSPLILIRRECLTCMGGSTNMVDGCETKECALYSYRLGKRPHGEPTALKALKAFCLACVDGNQVEVKNCTGPCHLHYYRLGRNPKRKGVGGWKDREKQVEAGREAYEKNIRTPGLTGLKTSKQAPKKSNMALGSLASE